MAVEIPITGTIETIEATNHGYSIIHFIKTNNFDLGFHSSAELVKKLKTGDNIKIDSQTSSERTSRHCLIATFTRTVNEIQEKIGEKRVLLFRPFSLK